MPPPKPLEEPLIRRRIGRLVEVDKALVAAEVRSALRGLLGDAKAIVRAYRRGAAPRSQPKDAVAVEKCVAFVVDRIKAASAGLVFSLVREWFVTQEPADQFLQGLETGRYALDGPGVPEKCLQVADRGTREQQQTLSQILRRLSGIRRGPHKTPLKNSEIQWIRTHIAELRAAVCKARGGARRQEDRDPIALRKFVAVHLPKDDWRIVESSVKSSRRPIDAVAEVVARKLGVGRKVAQRVIRELRA